MLIKGSLLLAIASSDEKSVDQNLMLKEKKRKKEANICYGTLRPTIISQIYKVDFVVGLYMSR